MAKQFKGAFFLHSPVGSISTVLQAVWTLTTDWLRRRGASGMAGRCASAAGSASQKKIGYPKVVSDIILASTISGYARLG